MPQTNAVMDFRTFARSVLGRQPGMQVGRDISEAEHEADKKAYDYYVKKGIDQVMTVQQPVQPPQFMSLTNSEGRVIDVLLKPNGDPQVVEPKVQNTQQGIMTMVNPTNAVPMVNPQTGQPLMGYAADPMMGGMPSPAPLAGGQMTATNAPTAAPMQTPAPSPAAPPQLRDGMRVRQNGITYVITNGVPVPVTGP
jgi:hypothetical protein